MKMFACDDEPPFLLIIVENKNMIEIIYDALRVDFDYENDKLIVHTPFFTITLVNNDKIANVILDRLHELFEKDKCHEAKLSLGIIDLYET